MVGLGVERKIRSGSGKLLTGGGFCGKLKLLNAVEVFTRKLEKSRPRSG